MANNNQQQEHHQNIKFSTIKHAIKKRINDRTSLIVLSSLINACYYLYDIVYAIRANS